MSGIRRRMTLPSVQGREDPIYKPPTKPASDPGHSAAFIFVHGLGDDAAGLENVADQFQNNNKLPHMNWIIPNARENRGAMQKAWYRPTPLTPFPSSRPELDEEEDEQGLMETVNYLESLIDACVNKGVPPNRIVLGGFSQGCAVSLLTDLVSAKYAGRLAGIVGLMGYLPLAENYRLQDMRAHNSLPPVHGDVPVFLARGKKDILIPTRIWNRSLKGLEAVGLSKDSLEVHEYEDMGHTITGPLLRDICAFLERVVPALED